MSKHLGKGGIVLIALILILLGVVFFKMAGYAVNIPSTDSNSTVFCQTLNASGHYIFIQDLLNENYTSSPCFNITASDVIFDCAGYSIENSTQSGPSIYAEHITNLTVRNCRIDLSNDNGIVLELRGVNDSFILNNNFSSNNAGISLHDSRNIQISGNTLNLNNNGILVNNSLNNVLHNNTLNSNSAAVRIVKSSGNSLSNNTFAGCSSAEGCLILEGSSSNSVTLGAISSSNTAIYMGNFDGLNSSNNIFTSVTFNGSVDLNVSLGGNINNTFMNSTYNSAKEFVSFGSEVIRKWHYRVFVNSTASSSGISGVNVTIYNASDSVKVSALTASDGYISSQELLSYRNNGTRQHLGLYVVVASNISSSANHSINLTGNLFNDYLSFNISVVASNSSSDDEEESTEPAAEPAAEPVAEASVAATSESTASTGTVTPSIYLEQSQIEGGYTAELSVSSTIYFNISGEFHSLTLDGLETAAETETKTITVTVSSEPQTFTLSIGEQKKLDYYDVLIGFDNLSFDEKPLILIMKINESIIKEPVVEQVITTTDDSSVTFGFIGSIERKVNTPIIGPITPLHIIIAVLVLCILIVGYIYFSYRKRKAVVKK